MKLGMISPTHNAAGIEQIKALGLDYADSTSMRTIFPISIARKSVKRLQTQASSWAPSAAGAATASLRTARSMPRNRRTNST